MPLSVNACMTENQKLNQQLQNGQRASASASASARVEQVVCPPLRKHTDVGTTSPRIHVNPRDETPRSACDINANVAAAAAALTPPPPPPPASLRTGPDGPAHNVGGHNFQLRYCGSTEVCECEPEASGSSCKLLTKKMMVEEAVGKLKVGLSLVNQWRIE